MNKKTKKKLIISSVVMVVIAIGIVITKSIPPTTSTEGISSFEDTTVDGLRFSNVKIVGNQLTALVQNTLTTKAIVNSITVKFYDKNNNEIDSVDAYLGSKLGANEMKTLDVKTDANLSNIGNITYQVNRTSCGVTILTGDLNTPGSYLKIGNEEFYVVSKSGDTYRLIAKKNLNTSQNRQSDSWNTTVYSCRECNCNSYSSMPISSTVNNYVTYLKTISSSVQSGSLLTVDEFNSLSSSIKNSTGNFWLYGGIQGMFCNYYWKDEGYTSTIAGWNNWRNGVRPLIILSIPDMDNNDVC